MDQAQYSRDPPLRGRVENSKKISLLNPSAKHVNPNLVRIDSSIDVPHEFAIGGRSLMGDDNICI